MICFIAMMPGGYYRLEDTLIWGILFFAIALCGVGSELLDHLIGKEL